MFYLGVVLQAVCGCFDLCIVHSMYKANARVRIHAGVDFICGM